MIILKKRTGRRSISYWTLFLSICIMLSGCVTAGTQPGAAPEDADEELPGIAHIPEVHDESSAETEKKAVPAIQAPEPENDIIPADPVPKAALIETDIIDDEEADKPEDDEEPAGSKSGTAAESGNGGDAESAVKVSENTADTNNRNITTSSSSSGRESTARKAVERLTAEKPAESTTAGSEPGPAIPANTEDGEILYARPGDLIHYPFEGRGWIYNGVMPDTGGLVFKEKKTQQADSVLFTFTAEKIGRYSLEFSKYDLAAGTEQVLNVPVIILSEEDFISIVGGTASGDVDETVNDLFDIGDYDGVVKYFEENSTDSPEEILILAISQKETGGIEKSIRLLNGLLDDPKVGGRAIVLLDEIANTHNRHDLLPALMNHKGYFDLDHSPEQLIKIGQTAADNGMPDPGIYALRQLVEKYSGYGSMDRVFWLLGNLLEMPGGFRDIREAVNIYSEITDNYPTSKYYEKAEARIKYLKRHYILIN